MNRDMAASSSGETDGAQFQSPSWTSRHWRLSLFLLVATSFVIRSPHFGNPFVHVDEEFYLLVGDRMLHGAIPYVDIWDRKPVGLFLLYAGIRLLGGEGFLQYQLVAALFAGLTAAVIATIARRITSSGAALLAGLAYVLALAMCGGQGGQTPVFYNLLVAIAAWRLVLLATTQPSPTTIRWQGAAAMTLIGLAIQIKYSPVFEGIFFGLVLLWLSWQASRHSIVRLVADGLLWIAAAAAPTLLAYGWYAANGHGSEFLFANLWSIAMRGASSAQTTTGELRKIAIRAALFLIPALLAHASFERSGPPWRRRDGGTETYRFLLGWLGAATTGFVLFGTYFVHYFLPLLVPLSILLSTAFVARGQRLRAVITLAAIVPLAASNIAEDASQWGERAYAYEMAAKIEPELKGRCLYVFYGEPALYMLTHSCLPSRWPFPFHLSLQREAGSIGVDSLTEAKRIMATRPPVVIDRDSQDSEINRTVQAYVRSELKRHYRLAFAHDPHRSDTPSIDQIWVLKQDDRATPTG